MKTKTIFSVALATILAFSIISCNKNNMPAKPVVTLTEVGYDNSKVAMRGHDMHLEADILSEGLIRRIDIEIHQENGSFELEIPYTSGKYIGVKNTSFHEHIDIPGDAPLGEYHLHFIVTDKKGQQTMVETHIDIIEYDETQSGGDED